MRGTFWKGLKLVSVLSLAVVVTAVPASAAYINDIRGESGFGWTSINRGDHLFGDGTYTFSNDGAGGAVTLATPTTPSGDNAAAVIKTMGTEKAKWDKGGMSATSGVTAFMVFQIGDNAKNSSAGNWSVMCLRAGTNMNINMAANASGGVATIYFDDKAVGTDPPGNIGTKAFTVPTNTWLQWWITAGAGTITIQDVSNGASPVTLATGAYTQSGGNSTVRFGDESSSTGKDSDLTFDEIYLTNSVKSFVNVPEPATLALLALGAFPLLRRRAR